MVKLDVTLLRYLSKDDFRVLTSVEMGMKNHELVSPVLIRTIANLKNANSSKILQQLTQHKLVSYERGKRFDGYRLTYLGYDYLALNTLANRNVISTVGNQIGVGKESDVYICCNENYENYVLKLHRLGRTCFRKVSLKRDYLKSGNKTNWIYLSRLAALREFAFMKALHNNSLPVPQAIDCNRHCLVMEFIDGTLLNHISKDSINSDHVPILYDKLINLIMSLANDYGLVHGDFNEFNILIKNDTNEPILIDFPQMIPTSHQSAQTYFERDVECIVNFFAKRFDYESDYIPTFENINVENENLQKFNDLVKQSINSHNSNLSDKLEVFEKFEQLRIEEEDENENEKDEKDKNEKDEKDEKEENDKKVEEKEIEIEKLYDDTIFEEFNFNIRSNESLNLNEEKNESEFSFGNDTVSVASTFSPNEIKIRLKRERIKKEKQNAIKKAAKSSKGESSAVIRKRKDNLKTVSDDLQVYKLDGF